MIDSIILVIQLAIIIFVPVLIIKIRNKKGIKFIGAIGVAYIIGILLALILFLIRKTGIDISFNTDVGEIGSHLAIGIAIPLLLFSTDFKQLKNVSKIALKSFGILTFSVIIVSITAFFIFKNVVADNGAISGMAIGLYTGGTPNLNAIGSILGVDSTVIATANISDMLVGGVFYLFLLTICKPLLSKFLTAPVQTSYIKNDGNVKNVDLLDSTGIKIKPSIRNLLIALLMVITGAGLGVAVWLVTGKSGAMTDYLVPIMLVTVTILGIAASFNKKIRDVKSNNFMGVYLILVFSLAIAMSMDFENMNMSSLYIFLELAFITVFSFILHVIISKIFKIDVDCTMVTATAGLYGPAFIPAITAQIKNENLTAVGLICGAIGYAFGTLLGAGLGYLLLNLF